MLIFINSGGKCFDESLAENIKNFEKALKEQVVFFPGVLHVWINLDLAILGYKFVHPLEELSGW